MVFFCMLCFYVPLTHLLCMSFVGVFHDLCMIFVLFYLVFGFVHVMIYGSDSCMVTTFTVMN